MFYLYEDRGIFNSTFSGWKMQDREGSEHLGEWRTPLQFSQPQIRGKTHYFQQQNNVAALLTLTIRPERATRAWSTPNLALPWQEGLDWTISRAPFPAPRIL